MLSKQVVSILERCYTVQSNIPPTVLFNEGWMLRIIVDWFFSKQTSNHPLSFPEDGKWYSEALLPSTFLPRYRGDKFSESYTHVDGAIGHFNIGSSGEGDLAVTEDSTHLVLLEAKMFSKLSSGVKNAWYYNQAARNVACMAEVLRRGNRNPTDFEKLGFFVLAPESQIEAGVFSNKMSNDSISEIVNRRIDEYDGDKSDWMTDWFKPLMQKIEIGLISWEELIRLIAKNDPDVGEQLDNFYSLCLKYNCRKIINNTRTSF